MTREWIAFRPDKDGKPRGYWRNIQKSHRRKRDFIFCPKHVGRQYNFTSRHHLTYNFLDKDELIEEMRNDPAMRGKRIPTKERKPALIVIWLRDGCHTNSSLLFDRQGRGTRQ